RSPCMVTVWLPSSRLGVSGVASCAAPASRKSTSASFRMSRLSVMPTHESQRSGATGAGRLWSLRAALHVPIGLLCVLAQPVLGQVRAEVRTEQVGEIAARNGTYQKRFRELL